MFITKTVICPFLPDLWITLCNLELGAIRFANALVSLGIMGMSAVTLKVPFLLKDGALPKSAADIYSSSVNDQGGREQGAYHPMELF